MLFLKREIYPFLNFNCANIIVPSLWLNFEDITYLYLYSCYEYQIHHLKCWFWSTTFQAHFSSVQALLILCVKTMALPYPAV